MTGIKGGLFRTALLIAGVTAFARVAGLGREMAIAAEYGTSTLLDSYLIAMAVPLFLLNTLSATLGPALSPALIGLRAVATSKLSEQLLIQDFNRRVIIALVLILVIIMASSYIYVPLVVAQLPPDMQVLTQRLALILAPYAALHGLSSMWIAALNSGRRFVLPAIVPIITPIAVLTLVLLASDTLSVNAIVYGTYIGIGVELALLIFLLCQHDTKFLPSLKSNDHGRDLDQAPGLAAFRQAIPLFISAAALNLIPLFDQLMAAQIGPGQAATFNFATRMILVANSIAMLALSQTITPIICHLKAQKSTDPLGRTARLGFLAFVGGAIVVSVVIAGFSELIIYFVFQRGNLGVDQAIEIAAVQTIFAAQLPFYIGFLFLSRVLAAFDGNKIAASAAAIGAVLNFVLNTLLLDIYGLNGIAVATIISYVVALGLLVVFFKNRRLPS
jgi:putative peptidoglycan lipid II flippase